MVATGFDENGPGWTDVEKLWSYLVIDSGPMDADLLLVLGCHDIRVADRAAEVFMAESFAVVIVTGGTGKVTSGWAETEAETFRRHMMLSGVPDDRILVEATATNLGENFELAHALAVENGLTVQTGVIVCKPYVTRRALAAAAHKWPSVAWTTRPPVLTLRDSVTSHVPLHRLVNLLVGNLQRLRVYEAAGYQAPVAIPGDVWEAFERLVQAGFVQDLVAA